MQSEHPHISLGLDKASTYFTQVLVLRIRNRPIRIKSTFMALLADTSTAIVSHMEIATGDLSGASSPWFVLVTWEFMPVIPRGEDGEGKLS